MYRQLNTQASVPSESSLVSLMAKKGENIRDLPQLLGPEFAQKIFNYIVTTDGGLIKRKGLEALNTPVGTDPGTLLEKWTDDIYIYAYDNNVYAWTKSTSTATAIKTDFTTSDPFSGQRYGDYFFVCNGGDKIGRISFTLDYDAQSANFNVGSILTGGTSGATAIILEDSDSGATGTLTLGSISGTFQDNEAITDDGAAPGSATSDGIVSFTYTEITNAPKAKILKVFGPRLYAGNLSDDESAVQYSGVDDGTNPPFNTWAETTDNTSGGRVFYRRGGAVKAIEKLADAIIVFQENGKFGFRITQLDSAGTLKKIEETDFEREDFGGSIATTTTDQGIFYVNESGLWQMVSLGRQDIPLDDQEFQTTVLLGKEYFDNVDIENSTIVYDPKQKYIFFSIGKDSDKNNQVIGYNTELKAISRITGWTINRFMEDNGEIYGISASSDKIYQCFVGGDDDGNDIFTEYEQELRTGNLETRQMLLGFYIQGRLSPSTTLDIAFDIYDREGNYVANKTTWQWSPEVPTGDLTGWGDTPWGGPWGGDNDSATLVDAFDGCRPFIRNYQRLVIRITSNDKADHEINWFSIQSKVKAYIRRRGINKLT